MLGDVAGQIVDFPREGVQSVPILRALRLMPDREQPIGRLLDTLAARQRDGAAVGAQSDAAPRSAPSLGASPSDPNSVAAPQADVVDDDVAASAPSGPSVVEQFRELATLYDAGALTEHEYGALKADLLKRL